MDAFSVQKSKLGFKKKTESQVLILDNSKEKLAYFSYFFVCIISLFISVYVNERRK